MEIGTVLNKQGFVLQYYPPDLECYTSGDATFQCEKEDFLGGQPLVHLKGEVQATPSILIYNV